MAVAAPPLFRSSRDYWESDTSSTQAANATGQMTEIMTYPYPSPSAADMTLPSSGYLPGDYSSKQHSPGMDQDPNVSPKSKNQKLKLKRSDSSPSSQPSAQSAMAQQVALQDQAALNLAADKRRNKLGYHRTSVACGHCRRRKIRCIPSPSDAQGRCVNCIRLKKECSFYPVDQQPPPDIRKSSASRTSTMAPPMKTQELFSSEQKLASSAPSVRSFDYGSGSIQNWMSDTGHSASKTGDWRSYPHESAIAPAYSQYTPHVAPSPASWTPQSGSSREDLGWPSYPAPPRSHSFGTETATGQHPIFPSISQMTSGMSPRPFDRKAGSMSDIYTPGVTTTVSGVDSVPGTTMDHAIPLSSTTAPLAYSWQTYSYGKSGSTSDGYNSWTADHATPSNEAHPTSSSMYYSGR